MMTSPILLSAIVGAGVSFLVTTFIHLVRTNRRSRSSYRSRETEIWE